MACLIQRPSTTSSVIKKTVCFDVVHVRMRSWRANAPIQNGACLADFSGLVYEDLTDDEDWHRSEAVNVESEEEAQDSDDEVGSLEDFVVDDEENEEVATEESYQSSDSGIVSVSPPAKESRSEARSAPADSNTRRERLNALLASRARRHGRAARVQEETSDEEPASSDERRSMSSDIAALEDPEESDSD